MQPLCDDFFREVAATPGRPSPEWNPAIRAYLDAVRAYLLDLDKAGAPAKQVDEEHTDLMDRLIRRIFRLAEDRYFYHSPRLNLRLAVVAVGGYGRRELNLASDIDLLFLHKGKMNPYVETVTESICHRLWDARLTVGAATRTITDCMRVGREDLSTLTSYLDARFLIGDPGLYAELERTVQEYIQKNRAEFIAAKTAEQTERHERFGESLYLLQPNVRESVGGLRDYHNALWIARAARWDVRKSEHLLLHGFIDPHELEGLTEALEFFWRLRNHLHRSGRKDDRMHFEAQEALAKELGFEGNDETLPVEALMRSYYLHARAVERVNRRTIEHAVSLVEKKRGKRAVPSRAIEDGFAIVEGKLEIPRASILQERPARLFSAFAHAQHHDVTLSVRAQRLIQQHLHLVDDDFRSDQEIAALFRQILSSPTRVYRSLQVMNETGLLGSYLLEFGKIVGLWNQDLYHTYTVDVHSLFLVEQLRRLRRGRYDEELPLAAELIREVRHPFVLYLSCILHDIGKGRGGGHSEKGAKMIPELGERLGLNDEENAAVELLVRHHLTKSGIAEQRDVNDPRTILRVGNLCGSREMLRLLYLLTVADIRSVSPVAWTSWKAGVLEALYRNTAEWFEAGAEEDASSDYFLTRTMDQADRTQEQVKQILQAQGVDDQRVQDFLNSMPRRYLLGHESGEIATHVASALRFIDSSQTVGVYTFGPGEDEAPFWGLVIFSRDQPGLFATVSGVLTACRHNILAANAYTTRESLAIEIYTVDPLSGGPMEEEHERERIESRLREVLEGRRDLAHWLAERREATPRVMRAQPPSVRVTNEESDFYTIIDVTTNDRPALLYDISRTLSDQNLDVVMSRASTRANQVTDAFYVTDRGHKLTDTERLAAIEDALQKAIRRDTA